MVDDYTSVYLQVMFFHWRVVLCRYHVGYVLRIYVSPSVYVLYLSCSHDLWLVRQLYVCGMLDYTSADLGHTSCLAMWETHHISDRTHTMHARGYMYVRVWWQVWVSGCICGGCHGRTCVCPCTCTCRYLHIDLGGKGHVWWCVRYVVAHVQCVRYE